jgi:ribonuclease HI
MLNIHTDASVNPTTKNSGIGIVVDDGTHIKKEIDYCSSTTAEWIAILVALRYVRNNSRNTEQVRIYTDSHSVAMVADGDSTPNAEMTKNMYKKYKQLREKFQDVRVIYINSELNKRADSLARRARKVSRDHNSDLL